jgi:hypothetical protein
MTEKKIPAIPPEDYKGSLADWMVALIERGLWDENKVDWYGDVQIPSSTYWEILEKCEGNEEDDE